MTPATSKKVKSSCYSGQLYQSIVNPVRLGEQNLPVVY